MEYQRRAWCFERSKGRDTASSENRIPFLEKYSHPEEAMRVLAADDQEARRLTILGRKPRTAS